MIDPHKTRKIIHVDMDCFYVAIEIRDNPTLKNKPVAVGGAADKRGVICTSNYIARKYGVHSAMSTASAYRLCPELCVLPVNMMKYRQIAKRIHAIFYEYTDLVEPLSLDEAYLDVSAATHYQGSATRIAEAIRAQIWEREKLTESAGVAPNKFLAKVASGWKKPNGLFVIRPDEINDFIKTLPVDELYGVGKITAKKLHQIHLKTCSDLQKLSLTKLLDQFGKLGQHLYEQCRGLDFRRVEPNRIRKSLSVEQTFTQNLNNVDVCCNKISELYARLIKRIQESAVNRHIKNQYIKIKFSDFKLITTETTCHEVDLERYLNLFYESYERYNKPIRLLGIGVHFHNETTPKLFLQQSLF